MIKIFATAALAVFLVRAGLGLAGHFIISQIRELGDTSSDTIFAIIIGLLAIIASIFFQPFVNLIVYNKVFVAYYGFPTFSYWEFFWLEILLEAMFGAISFKRD